MELGLKEFLERLMLLPQGYSTGVVAGRRYATSLDVSADKRRYKLFAEELAGPDKISFNLYLLDEDKPLLKPCEMPKQKVMDFVLE